jgi:hypothetical protein
VRDATRADRDAMCIAAGPTGHVRAPLSRPAVPHGEDARVGGLRRFNRLQHIVRAVIVLAVAEQDQRPSAACHRCQLRSNGEIDCIEKRRAAAQRVATFAILEPLERVHKAFV